MTTTDRRYGVAEGLAVKAPVRVATTAPISLVGLQTIDGVALAEGDRVLAKDQTTEAENGIYLASTGNWTRSVDFDGPRDIVCGTRVVSVAGTVGAYAEWILTSADPITIGTSSLTFQLSGFLFGADVGFKFQFNSALNGDPGSGKFRFNNGSFLSASSVSISETDAEGHSLAAYLATLDDSTSTLKCLLTFRKQGGSAVLQAWITGALTDSGAYVSFDITPIVGSGSFANNDVFRLTAIRTGDKGVAGDQSSLTIVNAVADYGAVGNGIADDGAAIQAALDYIAGLGGGGVYLPPGTYYSDEVLKVGSNTHLFGAGREATIIKNQPGAIPGKALSGGLNANCTIGTAGTTNVRISDLCVDHRAKTATVTISIASPGVVTWAGHGLTADTPVKLSTTGALPTGLTAGNTHWVKTVLDANSFTLSATEGGAVINTSGSQSGTHTAEAGTDANGIQVGLQSPVATSDAIVERCKVIGANTHQYNIWSLRSDDVKIRDNIVDSQSSGDTTVGAEGIEVFGGNRVEVYGNKVINAGSTGINVVENGGVTDTDINDINIHDNYVDGGSDNISVSVVSTGRRLSVVNNICLNANGPGGHAIKVGCGSGGTMSDVLVLGNKVRGTENIGIYLPCSGATLDKVIVASNSITAMTATYNTGIYAQGGPMLIQGNAIECSYSGIQHDAGTGFCVVGNQVKSGGFSLYFGAGSLKLEAIGNSLRADAAITCESGATGRIVGNLIDYVTAEVNPAFNVPATVLMRGNVLAYTPSANDPFGAGNNQLNHLIKTRVTSALPAANTVPVGTKEFVTDANATTFASTASGGGANKVPVWSDGTNWLIG